MFITLKLDTAFNCARSWTCRIRKNIIHGDRKCIRYYKWWQYWHIFPDKKKATVPSTFLPSAVAVASTWPVFAVYPTSVVVHRTSPSIRYRYTLTMGTYQPAVKYHLRPHCHSHPSIQAPGDKPGGKYENTFTVEKRKIGDIPKVARSRGRSFPESLGLWACETPRR